MTKRVGVGYTIGLRSSESITGELAHPYLQDGPVFGIATRVGARPVEDGMTEPERRQAARTVT